MKKTQLTQPINCTELPETAVADTWPQTEPNQYPKNPREVIEWEKVTGEFWREAVANGINANPERGAPLHDLFARLGIDKD